MNEKLTSICAWCHPHAVGPNLTHTICEKHWKMVKAELQMKAQHQDLFNPEVDPLDEKLRRRHSQRAPNAHAEKEVEIQLPVSQAGEGKDSIPEALNAEPDKPDPGSPRTNLIPFPPLP